MLFYNQSQCVGTKIRHTGINTIIQLCNLTVILVYMGGKEKLPSNGCLVGATQKGDADG